MTISLYSQIMGLHYPATERYAVDEFEVLTMPSCQKLNEERAEILVLIGKTGSILT